MKVLFFLTGQNLASARKGLELGDVPRFSLLELSSLASARFGSTCIIEPFQYHHFRLVQGDLPFLDEPLFHLLDRATSLGYTGTIDYAFTSTFHDITRATEEFTRILCDDPVFHEALTSFHLPEGTFAIGHILHGMSAPEPIDASIRDALAGTIRARLHANVDLRPSTPRVYVIVTARVEPPHEITFIVSFHGMLKKRRGYGKRSAKFRPKFEVGTMNPPLATLMVNAAQPPLRQGHVVVDPFCGTGGLLIEAVVRGLPVMGMDIDRACIHGCKENVRFFNNGLATGVHFIRGSVFAPPLRLPLAPASGSFVTVTDPPYGRLESLRDRPFSEYIRSMLSIAAGHDKIAFAIPASKASEVLGSLEIVQDQFNVFVEERLEHPAFSRTFVLLHRKSR